MMTKKTQSRFAEVDDLKHRLDAHRPLDAAQVGAVEDKLRLDWTYNSNAIEGNPLTLSETSFFLREGLTSKGKPLSAFLEAKNHLEAIDYLQDFVDKKAELIEGLVKGLHAILFKGIDTIQIGPPGREVTKPINPGAYKNENNHVIRLDGSIHQYTDFLQVPGDMERLFGWCGEAESKLHPIELAALFHHKLVAIHPFLDGNGRVSRLCMNLILLREGYSPAIIKQEERQEYYRALEAADADDYEPFISIVEREATATLQLGLDVVEGREAFDLGDLDRLLTNVATTVVNIETELGRHAKSITELRTQLLTAIGKLLATPIGDHLKAQQAKSFPFSIQHAGSWPALLSGKLNMLSQGAVMSQEYPGIILQANLRMIPMSQLAFGAVASKYNAQLYAVYAFAELSASGDEKWPNQAASIEGPTGPLYTEDWHEEEITEFVVQSLKKFYQAFGSEVAKRRELITTEELGATKG